MLKKFFILGVVFLMAFTLWACDDADIPYNAVLYDDAGEWINIEFKAANATAGVIPGDDALPKSRAWLIATPADYDGMLMGTPFNCDFDNQMLVLYTFTTAYVRTVKLTKASKNDSVLDIEFEMVKPKGTGGGAVRDYQRWLLIKLDKIEVDSANVAEKK